jgi:hypothetical protein
MGCKFQAAVASGVWSSSNSIGVILPRARCRHSRWYVRSIQVTIASRSSARVAHRCRSTTLRCRSAKKDSMAALSPHAPTRPVDPHNRCATAHSRTFVIGIGCRGRRGRSSRRAIVRRWRHPRRRPRGRPSSRVDRVADDPVPITLCQRSFAPLVERLGGEPKHPAVHRDGRTSSARSRTSGTSVMVTAGPRPAGSVDAWLGSCDFGISDPLTRTFSPLKAPTSCGVGNPAERMRVRRRVRAATGCPRIVVRRRRPSKQF